MEFRASGLFCVLFFLFMAFFSACEGENNEQNIRFMGEWTVVKALQDGIETNRLDGIFLRFAPEYELSTNFNTELEPRTYEFKIRGQLLTAKRNGEEIQFRFEHDSENELKLFSKLMDFDFELHLQRQSN